MKRSNSLLRKLLIGSVALMALFAVAGSALFFTSPAAAQVAGEVLNGEADALRRGGRGDRGGSIDKTVVKEAVANELGITVEELETAKEAGTSWRDLADEAGVDHAVIQQAIYNATVSAINTALDNGDIDQEQADRMLERAEIKFLKSQVIDKDALKQVKADALGITVEEMEAAKEAGTRLSELAEANGTTAEEVKAAVEAAKQAMVDAAVADGTITAEQGEQIMEGGKRGNRDGGRRGGGERGPQAPAADNA